MEFSRHKYWSGLLCPPPGHLPDPGTEPEPLRPPALAGGFFTTAPPEKPIAVLEECIINMYSAAPFYSVDHFNIEYISKILTYYFNRWYYIVLEKAVAPHSSTLAWRIPWTEEPGRLQSMGLLRVGHG